MEIQKRQAGTCNIENVLSTHARDEKQNTLQPSKLQLQY